MQCTVLKFIRAVAVSSWLDLSTVPSLPTCQSRAHVYWTVLNESLPFLTQRIRTIFIFFSLIVSRVVPRHRVGNALLDVTVQGNKARPSLLSQRSVISHSKFEYTHPPAQVPFSRTAALTLDGRRGFHSKWLSLPVLPVRYLLPYLLFLAVSQSHSLSTIHSNHKWSVIVQIAVRLSRGIEDRCWRRRCVYDFNRVRPSATYIHIHTIPSNRTPSFACRCESAYHYDSSPVSPSASFSAFRVGYFLLTILVSTGVE